MNGAAPPEELRRQYDRALDEYRFQVDLNWRRFEYFFVLNVGVLIAAATIFSSDDVPRALVALLFLIGALLALLSILANESQHSYYRSARTLKQELETELNLKEVALATTPGMGSRFGRIGRVRTFLKIMLIAIALVDLAGAAFAVDAAKAIPNPPGPALSRFSSYPLTAEPGPRWPLAAMTRSCDSARLTRRPPRCCSSWIRAPTSSPLPVEPCAKGASRSATGLCKSHRAATPDGRSWIRTRDLVLIRDAL